ncbi:MAG TPA: dTMP kinase [Thermomicrobiales bacterium]|nr:dTMP kinase [Thermomicrobiales bacterium]
MSSRTAAAEATDNTPSILPGKLLVIEGIDRSGRSTQVQLLVEWLRHNGIEPVRTDWSTSPHISKAIHKAKAAGELRPITFSLFYAADFTDRIANVVVPALERGQIVVADRYVYTAFARDIARGADPGWLETLYGFAPAPDAVFYLRVPPSVTRQRVPSTPVKAIDRYEAGLDLGLSVDPGESFQIYQQRVFDEFERLAREYQFTVIDGDQDVDAIAKVIRKRTRSILDRPLTD